MGPRLVRSAGTELHQVKRLKKSLTSFTGRPSKDQDDRAWAGEGDQEELREAHVGPRGQQRAV